MGYSGCGSNRRKSTVCSRLPDNWIELEGVAEKLEQFSREDIRRQEVSVDTGSCGILGAWGFVVGEALGHKECSRRRTCIMGL